MLRRQNIEHDTGSYNVVIGNELFVDFGTTLEEHNTYLNGEFNVLENNTIEIKKTASTDTYIHEIFNSAISDIPVNIDSTGKLGITTSTRDKKYDIQPIDEETNRMALLKLKPRTFKYKETDKKSKGLIYDEDLHIKHSDGTPVTIRHDQINIMLLTEVQRLSRENEILKTLPDKIQSITETNSLLLERIANLENTFLLERLAHLENLIESDIQ